MSATWTAADVPDQSGRVAVVTGANAGIGYEAAAVLVGHPVLVQSNKKSHDVAVQERLWSVSEELTGVKFGV